MPEKEIFWLGGKPNHESSEPRLADSPDFADAMRSTFESMGCEYERLISAQGPYGTWLVEFRRGGEQQRVLWNGKDAIMVLQQQRPGGGWDDPREVEVSVQDQNGFIAAVREILSDTST